MLTTFGVGVGDPIVIGQATFTIRGVILSEPGRGMGQFNLGPGSSSTTTTCRRPDCWGSAAGPGGLCSSEAPDSSIDGLVKTLRADFREDFINTRSYRNTEDQIGRDFDRAENYLSLVGLVIVILGGIAVSSVTRVFILQKMRSIAVLKCVGARSAQIIGIYVMQMLLLGFARAASWESCSPAPPWRRFRWLWVRRPPVPCRSWPTCATA